MNTKEQSEILMEAIQKLMKLYQDITEKIPRLLPPELKKTMTTKSLFSQK